MAEPIVELRGIKKSFPGVHALKGIDMKIYPGEVHGLVGENGAGKSVLLKTMLGAINKDEGDILINGEVAEISKPSDAENYGISAVYQDVMLAGHLSVAENISLNHYPTKGKGLFIDGKALNARAKNLLSDLDDSIDVRDRVSDLSLAKQQMVAIAKALAKNIRVLILDEPTAILTGDETEKLFSVVSDLKSKGISIIYVSHRLEEVFEICDTLTILRNGEKVGDFLTSEITREEMIRHMAGQNVEESIEVKERKPDTSDAPALTVKNLSSEGVFEDVSFSVDHGEIVGFYGLVGAGRSEVMHAVFGADKYGSGSVEVNGKKINTRNCKDGINAGIGLVPEDRRGQGVAVRLSIKDNINLANLKGITSHGFINGKAEKNTAVEYVQKLKIKTPGINQQTQFLSGGNMQKVAIAKWLNVNPDVLIFDEPTVGVDVGAKFEIYRLLQEFADSGKGVIFVSSYLPELTMVCDRIIVMAGGRITGELTREEFDQEKILDYAFRIEAL